MKKLKIKNGDNVEVITGDDKGKTGTVLNIDPAAMKVQVSGVRINTKLNKRERTLFKEEGWLDYSNIKLANAPKKKTRKEKDDEKSLSERLSLALNSKLYVLQCPLVEQLGDSSFYPNTWRAMSWIL